MVGVGALPLILWIKILSKTCVTINLWYGLILIHNENFGQEHIKTRIASINLSVICYILPLSLLFFLYMSHLLLLHHLLSLSTWIAFGLIKLFSLWLFIMNGDLWGILHCSDVHLDKSWSYSTLLLQIFHHEQRLLGLLLSFKLVLLHWMWWYQTDNLSWCVGSYGISRNL